MNPVALMTFEAMESSADVACVLKINANCETCKMKVYEVLRSISGVYSVTIDADEGLAKISGEVDPNILLSALGRSGKHAELKWVKLKSPAPNRGYYDDGYSLYNNNYNYYGQGRAYPTIEKPYHNTRSTLHEGVWCDSHQRYWPQSLPEFSSYNYSPASGSHYYPYNYPMHGHNMM